MIAVPRWRAPLRAQTCADRLGASGLACVVSHLRRDLDMYDKRSPAADCRTDSELASLPERNPCVSPSAPHIAPHMMLLCRSRHLIRHHTMRLIGLVRGHSGSSEITADHIAFLNPVSQLPLRDSPQEEPADPEGRMSRGYFNAGHRRHRLQARDPGRWSPSPCTRHARIREYRIHP